MLNPGADYTGLKVAISREDFSGHTKILIFMEKPDGRVVTFKPFPLIAQVSENWEKARDEGTGIIEPTLRIDASLAPSFLQNLADALTNLGYKTKSMHRMEGILEAQERHIADLRAMLNLPLKASGKHISPLDPGKHAKTQGNNVPDPLEGTLYESI